MLFKIPDLLTSEELQLCQNTLAQAEFVDGQITAGWYAKLVKHNQQLSHKTPDLPQLKTTVEQALTRHPLFQAAVRPRKVHSLLFSRYTAGMSYGRHTDNAFILSHHHPASS